MNLKVGRAVLSPRDRGAVRTPRPTCRIGGSWPPCVRHSGRKLLMNRQKVAQICNLLYRRFRICTRARFRQTQDLKAAGRLQICVTSCVVVFLCS